MEYPCPLADGRLLNEWHQTTFVRYLRHAFRWGGLPGLERSRGSEREKVPLAGLIEGLLPL